MFRALAAAVIAASAILLFGCSGGGDPPTKATATRRGDSKASADSRAKSMLLTVGDFPLGWAETAQPADDVSLSTACPSPKTDQIGRAESGAFSRGSTVVTQSVAVYANAGAASAAVQELGNWVECLQKYILAGKLDAPGTKATEVAVEPASNIVKGDAFKGYRVTIRYTAAGGVAGVEYVEILDFSRGPNRANLQMFGNAPALEVPGVAEVPAKALGKLR
jgi:hypothetical protein